MFEDLYTYEIVLLIAGFLLFLALLVLVVVQTTKEKPIKPLLFFFVPAIIMMGYPGIQSFSISKDKLELTKIQEQVMENPEDEESKEQLAEVTRSIEKRAKTDRDYVQLSKSYLLLNENDKALQAAQKALAINSNHSGAKQILIVAEAKASLDQPDELSAAEKRNALEKLKNSTWLNNHQVYKKVTLEKYKPLVIQYYPMWLDSTVNPVIIQ